MCRNIFLILQSCSLVCASMAPEPLPKAPFAEMAIALGIAVLLDAVGTAKCALMSVRYDKGVSSGWRTWSARADSFLGFGADVSDGAQRLQPRLAGLHSGWLWGRQVDLSDDQWRGFRGHLPLLVTVALVTAPLIHLARYRFGKNAMPKVHAAYGALFVAYLHGTRFVWIVVLIGTHFTVCHAFCGKKGVGIPAVWLSAIAQLALAQFTAHRWRFGGLAENSVLKVLLPGAFANFSQTMDHQSHHGILPRWWVHHNLLVLRLVSYGVDLHHARVRKGAEARDDEKTKATKTKPMTKTDDEKPNAKEPTPEERRDYDSLARTPSRAVSYSAYEYVAYCLYPPLYLAGPTAVFDAFASQLRTPQSSYSRRRLVYYVFVKFGAVLLLLEVWTHLIYTKAMAKNRVWTGAASVGNFGPFEVGFTSLATLNFMWLKFTVIWRFFRTWSLLSGVEVPENTTRCVNNNATILGFWKGWHASYNKWLVRYLHIPLGGSKYKLINAFVVFGFVGAWHDRVSPRLFWWAMIFAAFLAPETLVGALGEKLFPTTESRSTRTFRLIRSFLGAVNVHVLITGNMVGYVVGMDGANELVGAYFSRGVW